MIGMLKPRPPELTHTQQHSAPVSHCQHREGDTVNHTGQHSKGRSLVEKQKAACKRFVSRNKTKPSEQVAPRAQHNMSSISSWTNEYLIIGDLEIFIIHFVFSLNIYEFECSLNAQHWLPRYKITLSDLNLLRQCLEIFWENIRGQDHRLAPFADLLGLWGLEVNETRPNLASDAPQAARKQSKSASLFRAPRTRQPASGTFLTALRSYWRTSYDLFNGCVIVTHYIH